MGITRSFSDRYVDNAAKCDGSDILNGDRKLKSLISITLLGFEISTPAIFVILKSLGSDTSCSTTSSNGTSDFAKCCAAESAFPFDR
jgi:hypothetical protein